MIIFLVVHAILCVIVFLLSRHWSGVNREVIMPVVIFVPVVGVLLFAYKMLADRKKMNGRGEVEFDNFKIQEARFRRIEIDEKNDNRDIVPMEEAMLFQDSKTSRSLLMDIVQQEPDQYTDLLMKASLSEDTEITHYATTTMMEIQSGYEKRIREAEKKLSEKPESISRMRQLRLELDNYVKSGLISGHVLEIYQTKLIDLLGKMMEKEADNKIYRLDRIRYMIEGKRYVEAEKDADAYFATWPEDENGLKCRVSLYHATHRGEKIREVMAYITEKKIYLSSEGKEWFNFWNR